MKSEIANGVHEELQTAFGSLGKRIEPSKPVLPPRPQDPITTVYEFKSPAGQIYTVSYKTLKGQTLIVVDPPVGENPIIAETSVQAEILVAQVKLMLELEQKITQPIRLGRTAQEKVLA